ncbi:hypothetical protein ACWDDN_37665 [Streptomyces griseoruber]
MNSCSDDRRNHIVAVSADRRRRTEDEPVRTVLASSESTPDPRLGS